MEDLYTTLGIGRDAESREIKKAYFDLAKVHHPDKGGNEEKFKKIQNAYDVLSDDDKRRMYDMTGNANPNDSPQGGGPGFSFRVDPFGGMRMPGMGGMGGIDLNDLFGGMFNGGVKRKMKKDKGPSKMHEVPLSLKDYYFGKKLQFDLDRQVFCGDCNGQGCLNWKTCGDCRGTGVREQMVQIGPGMMAINRGACGTCNAEGKMRGQGCVICSGKGLVTQGKTLESQIKPGAGVGDIITFREMCSENQEYDRPGDVTIRLVKADEEIDLVREGYSLKHECTVGLAESLLGCSRKIKSHPGFPDLSFDIPIGTQNTEVICVKGKGMPNGVSFGDLYIRVFVKVTEDERKTLELQNVILQSIFTKS